MLRIKSFVLVFYSLLVSTRCQSRWPVNDGSHLSLLQCRLESIGIWNAAQSYLCVRNIIRKKGTASPNKGRPFMTQSEFVHFAFMLPELLNHIKNGFFPLPTHESCASKVIKFAAAAYFAMSQRTNRCWIGNFKRSLLSEMIFTLNGSHLLSILRTGQGKRQSDYYCWMMI